MNKFLNNLKHQAEENPMLAVIAAGGAVATATQLINSLASAYGRRTWSKEVKRRSKNM